MLHLPTQAPDWVIRTAAVGTAAVPRNDVIRSALTVPVIMGTAYALFGADVAIFASLSALLIVLSERGGTTGQRLLRSGAGLAAGTIAQLLGPLTAGTGASPLLVVLGFGLLSGVMSGIGSGLSWAAMQLLVQMAIAGGLHVSLPHRDRVIAYIVGGLIALAAMLVQSALERTDRLYSESLERAEQSFAKWAQSDGTEDARDRRAVANAQLLEAAELILVARPVRAARKRRIEEARTRLSAVALASEQREAGTGRHERETTRAPAIRPISVAGIVGRGLTSASTWEFVARLECCLALGELVRQLSPLGHGYWILLTIALVLKPDIQSVFSRTLQRGTGTLLGVSLAWIPTLLAPGFVIFPLIAALSAPIPWAVRRNYWIFSVLVTPLVLLILDFGGTVDFGVVVQRVLNTSIGCAIVLLVGYLLWPTTWRPRLARSVTRIVNDLADYASVGPDERNAPERRLQALMSIHELRQRVDRAAPEPPAVRARLSAATEVGAAADDVLMAVAPIRDDQQRALVSARLRVLSGAIDILSPTSRNNASRCEWDAAIHRLEAAVAHAHHPG
jgi:hypothetical protein